MDGSSVPLALCGEMCLPKASVEIWPLCMLPSALWLSGELLPVQKLILTAVHSISLWKGIKSLIITWEVGLGLCWTYHLPPISHFKTFIQFSVQSCTLLSKVFQAARVCLPVPKQGLSLNCSTWKKSPHLHDVSSPVAHHLWCHLRP